MPTKEEIAERQTRMERKRQSFETKWGEIARLVYPEMDGFNGMSTPQWNRMGQAPESDNHDPYAALALDDGVSVFEGFVMPRGKRWQKLALADELMRSIAVRQWVELVERRLFNLRHDPESNFVPAIHKSGMSLFSFGAQSMWVETRYNAMGQPAGLTYLSEFIGEIYVETDADGRFLRGHRKFGLTAEQAQMKFGDRAPAAVKKAMAKDSPPDTPFEFIHWIYPNRSVNPSRIDARGMAWEAGYYLLGGEDEVFMEGGYRSLPRIFSIYSPTVRGDWGYSPTMRVLPEIRLLSEIKRARTFGAEMRLIPPVLLPDDELDGALVEYYPGGATRGGLDDRGNARVQEMLSQSDATDAKELSAEARAAIDKAFMRDLLQLNREFKTHITATRTAEEMAEKGILLAPLARQEADWLSPMTQRELVLMGEMGLLDDMPPEVAEYFAASGTFNWRYDNQMSRLMQASETAGFLSFAEQVGALAQFDQSGETMEQFRRTYPMARVLPRLGENAGVPASMMATEKELAAYDAKKKAEEQQQLALQAVPVIADAAKNVAAAGATNGG